jgi:chromate transporter
MLARGRLGGLLAGLGFMLPGLVLMFILSWFYLTYGISSPLFHGTFLGFQAAVVALIVRAVHRIGGHALHDRWLFDIAVGALVGSLLGAPFAITLIVAGLAYVLIKRKWTLPAIMLEALFLVGVVVYTLSGTAAEADTVAAIGSTSTLPALSIFALALAGVYLWKARAAVAEIVLCAGILGLLVF